MPKVRWTGDDFRTAYQEETPLGVKKTYGRYVAYATHNGGITEAPETSEYAKRRDTIIGLGVKKDDSILIVGCGFGFLIDRFRAVGYENVWGVDYSPFVEENIAKEMPSMIPYITFGDVNDFTGSYDWVITESVIDTWTDAEIRKNLPKFTQLLKPGIPRSHMVHVVNTIFIATPPGFFNEKTLSQWKQLNPANIWIEVKTHEICEA